MASVVPLFREVGEQCPSGREAELGALIREHEEARASQRARFVFLRGQAGVGKSHLFRLLRRGLAARGVSVFEAESPREARRPFGLFTQLLSELLEHLSHSGLPAPKLAELTRALEPLLGRVEPPAARAWEERRLALHDAACELFLLAGRAQPLFLFPDLDAADRASLELFRYIAAVSTSPESSAGGLFVASLRDDALLPAPLEELLGKVNARSIALSGLDVDGIRAFLSRAELAERLWEKTGGNPDAIEQLLERPAAQPADLFLRRAERLSPSQRKVLAALAAAPAPLAQEVLLGALSRLGAESCAADLDQLVRAHCLTVKVAGERPAYRFCREAERRAFQEAILPEELRRAKAAVGEELRARGELLAASELLLEVDPAGQGAQVALAAAEELHSRGAQEDAAELYARALAHLPPEGQARALRAMSEIAASLGSFRSSLLHLLRVRRLVRLPPKELAELANQAARLLIRSGRLGLAERVLPVASAHPEVREAARANLAELQLLRGKPEQALAICQAALQSQGSEAAFAIELRNVMGKAHLLRNELSLAEEAFAQNLEQARAHHLSQLASLALLNLGVTAHKKGELQRAIGCYQATIQGHRPAQARALANLGSLYADNGDFELALEHLSRAMQAFSRFGAPREVAHAASNLARLCHFLGELDRAVELSEHALRLAEELGERYLEGSALLNLGAALLDKQERAEAQRLLDQARLCFEQVGNQGYAALAAALKAKSHLAAGERAQATAELSRRCVEKGAAQLSAAAVEVELTRGELCLALGDLHGAGRAAARARETLLSRPELEGPFRVYFLMGKLRQAAGDSGGAQAELARAARLLDQLVQRVAPARRTRFLALAHRAEVLAASEPELRLPRIAPAPRKESASHGLVGSSPSLLKLTRQLEPIGRSSATVLIRGESGTGKELLAEAIHQLSPRKGMPLVKVNCAAMVEELLLSELFGHEKGAFTGAVRERKGRFEIADGGTLFLDEIGDISPGCQVALLRVLQEREFERVGGSKTLKVDVRVICATNRDLESMIAQGRFRKDLYYRLKGVMLELPPLRERSDDLPLLAEHFLGRLAQERQEAPKRLSQQALELLGRHSWPGNVRELENVLASAAIFAEGSLIGTEAFSHVAELAALSEGQPRSAPPAPPPPAEVEAPAPSRPGPLDFYDLARTRKLSLKELRREMELQCIRRALEEASGNISEAARLLRMKRSRLSQIVNSEPELKGMAHG